MTTKAYRRQRGCLRKILYRNISEAQQRVSEMEQEVIYDKMIPEAYPCLFGKHFHVGHNFKARSENERV